MIWLEMSRDETHGGKGWAFTECLWCPSHKNPEGKWGFWESLLEVKEGDYIFHLRGRTHKQLFVGYSIADSAGYETSARPPEPDEWGYAHSYYRVPLREFTAFADPISLDSCFLSHDRELRKYFEINRNRPGRLKERLFYVVQSNRLQCLNGAYCSEVSRELANILFGLRHTTKDTNRSSNPEITARTGQQLGQVAVRLGQKEFSDLVRENYGNSCCFPGCLVTEPCLLVGAHIARWADAEALRGNVSNGLCLCLMHDKAFETGMFTLSSDYKVTVNSRFVKVSTWARMNLLSCDGRSITLGFVKPSAEAVDQHRNRINRDWGTVN